MAGGGALIATEFGKTVGNDLMAEGAADIFTVYQAYSTRQFKWSDFMIQKSVSLVISAACMGLQGIKEAGKGINNIVRGVEQEVVEQAGTRAITNARAIGVTLKKTGNTLQKLALQQIGVATTGKTIMKVGLNELVNFSSHFVLEQFKTQIS
jgi:hypothetical protein